MILVWLLACSEPLPVVLAEDTAASAGTEAAEPVGWESAMTCAACHPTHYAEWSESMHAYAPLSPVFDAMALKAFRDSSGAVGTFCTGCHSPIGQDQGEPGSATAEDRSRLSREGVTCDACHTAVGHAGTLGNAAIERELGEHKRGPLRDPDTSEHSAGYGEFVTSPELCGGCHDVFAWPGLLIEQAYSEYSASPAAATGVRCQDCHMGPVPGVAVEREWGPAAIVDGVPYPDRPLSSHRFVGPDYSLRDDFPHPADPEAGALARARNLERVAALLRAAATLRDAAFTADGLGVLLVSTTDGHRVPTGFTSERQMWVDVTVWDAAGEVVFRSGDLDADGNLRDVHSARVHAGEVALDDQLVNLQSRNLAALATQDEATVGESVDVAFPFEADWILRRSLEPREERRVTWRFDGGSPPARAELHLRYRNLPPYVLSALQLDALIERLHIFTIASLTVEAP